MAIEAVDGLFGNYSVYLVRDNSGLRYGINYGGGVQGWKRWTLAGAQRKGKRELARLQAAETAVAMRRAKIEALGARGGLTHG